MENCRPADDVELVDIAKSMDVAAGIEQRSHDLQFAFGGCPVQGVGVVSGLAGVRIRTVLDQVSGDVRSPLLGGLVQSRPAREMRIGVAGSSEAWVLRQQAAQALDIAFGTGREEAAGDLGLLFLDLGLQGAPTGKAVVSSYGQQRRSELCLRISPAEIPQSILGQFSQIFE